MKKNFFVQLLDMAPDIPGQMSPLDPLTCFGSLAARLGDAFADRAALLLSAGLDESAWASQVEQWSARFAADASGELARRFTAVYTGALVPREAAPVAEDPRFLTTEAQPWREEAACAGAVAHESAPPLHRPVAQPPEQTQDCPIYTPQDGALPFGRPSVNAAGSPFPSKRLHRFDPQTGLPLPAPVWVDLPQAPSLKP